MSDELSSLEVLASDYRGGFYRLSAISLAVLFYATKYWKAQFNWYSNNPLDTISAADWNTIQSYVDGLLYEVKNPMLGQIFAFATTALPDGVLPCDGSQYEREEYPDLYAILDTAFIVDSDNFVTPNLEGKTIIGIGNPAMGVFYDNGDVGGEIDHQLTVDELAAHDHTIPLTATTLAVEPGEVTVTTPIPILTANTGSTGSNVAHNNMQPYMALTYGIVAQ